MKAKDLRNRDMKELTTMLEGSRKKLNEMKFEFSARKLKNIKEVGTMKKEIARILTVINEKHG